MTSKPTLIKTQTLRQLRFWADLFLKGWLLLILVCVIVPWSPKMPAPGLDASWAIALNQAIAQGLLFGKDIIFTLGPYSAIYTKAYHPATDVMMMCGSFYIALSYWVAMLVLMRRNHWWILAYSMVLLGMMYARDSLFFSYPVLVGLTLLTGLSSPEHRPHGSRDTVWLTILLFTPFGLLPLIKGSFLVVCLAVVSLCALYHGIQKQSTLALLTLFVPLISMSIFWVTAGQSLNTLPAFLSDTLTLSFGFTQAMSTDANPGELCSYLLAALAQLFTIILEKNLDRMKKILLFNLLLVFLFLSFKAGFTRALGHVFIPATSIAMAALLLPLVVKGRFLYPVILVSFLTSITISHHYTNLSVRKNILSLSMSTWFGLTHRIMEPERLRLNYNAIMRFLKNKAHLPELKGTTDIYSYHQTDLIASGNHWFPRPIFQSYSVFTPRQAYQNKEYLLGPKRPETLFFKIEPIDKKLPALEDGASWPILLSHYQPMQSTQDYLILRKKHNNILKPELIDASFEEHAFNEWIDLPTLRTPLFAEISIQSTWLGYVANVLYQQHPLYLQIVLSDGTQRQYRIIPNMAKAGFLLSPLIEHTQEFAKLYSKNHALEHKSVQSFLITSGKNHSRQWQKHFRIRLSHLNS